MPAKWGDSLRLPVYDNSIPHTAYCILHMQRCKFTVCRMLHVAYCIPVPVGDVMRCDDVLSVSDAVAWWHGGMVATLPRCAWVAWWATVNWHGWHGCYQLRMGASLRTVGHSGRVLCSVGVFCGRVLCRDRRMCLKTHRTRHKRRFRT